MHTYSRFFFVKSQRPVLNFREFTIYFPIFLSGMVAMGVSIAAMIGSGMLVRSIPYQEGFGNKQMAWLLHSAVVGAVVAPIMLLGGPILTR